MKVIFTKICRKTIFLFCYPFYVPFDLLNQFLSLIYQILILSFVCKIKNYILNVDKNFKDINFFVEPYNVYILFFVSLFRNYLHDKKSLESLTHFLFVKTRPRYLCIHRIHNLLCFFPL